MQKNVAIEPELLERVGKVALAEGKTIDELTAEALKRDLARRSLERVSRQADKRRRGMTDQEVEAVVEKAVHSARGR